MLLSLQISNYALIDRITIEPRPGFNVITGETGAGKSIILGALSLLLGARADTRTVRRQDAKSVIEAIFSIDNPDELSAFCAREDIEWSDDSIILRREILPSGRSRAFVNDSPVPLSKLRDLSLRLIDIHSQHHNQLLATPAFQLDVIDTLAGNADRLREYRKRFDALRDAVRRLKAMRAKAEKDRDDEQFTRFQLEQIEELRLLPGEQADLERQRDLLTSVADVKASLALAVGALADDAGGALSRVDTAIAACARLDRVLDLAEDIAERLESLRIDIADIAATLSAIDENTAADPAALAAAEERLEAIYTLCHKHRLSDADELLQLRDTLRLRLQGIEDSDQAIADLEREARRAKALARELAAEISRARHEAAERFAALLTETAAPLGMKNLRCEVRVDPADMTATGIDAVTFMAAFNKNQPLMPVGDTASGGEISRLMLSIKSIIASRMQLPAIIFDEIDTGVSGEVADSMGRMMRSIAASIQVTAITHLPQVASLATTHFRVYKEDDADATHTRLALLTPSERVAAIAAMLGGAKVDDAAISAARSLLSATD